jgi:hypothetical protein
MCMSFDFTRRRLTWEKLKSCFDVKYDFDFLR